MQAVTDLELVQLARLAAASEGVAGDSIESLVAGGFLPAGFGRGVDGSGPILTEGHVIDSLRGRGGTFLPVPDVNIRFATSAEVTAYNERANYFAEKWRQLDPVVVSVRREITPGDPFERLRIEANISPLAEEKYGWLLSLLGPPVQQQVAPRDGDVVSFQAFVTGGQLSNTIPPHLLFVSIQDVRPVLSSNTGGLWETLQLLRTTPGYLGAWPKPGFLDWLPYRAPLVPDGYSQLPLGLWRWQGNDFSVLSFDRNLLETSVPQLRIEHADRPAQVRLHVGDLNASQLRDWVNGLYYQRARETSQANVQLLQALTQQLKLPPQDALATAERLLDTHLLCPLDGKYELRQGEGLPQWHSTALTANGAGSAASDFRAPLLQWFRGLDLSLTRSDDGVELQVDARMQNNVPRKTPSATLPLLNLFKGSVGNAN
jgi:hypothetical protein